MLTSTVPVFAAEEQQKTETNEKKYVDRSEITVEFFGARWHQEEFRTLMWDIYNTFGFDITLEIMNIQLPSPHNHEWLLGNVDFYVNALFNHLWLGANGHNSISSKFMIYGPSTLD